MKRMIGTLALVTLIVGGAAHAQDQLSEESFGVNARAHAHAVKTAYHRVEEFIVRGSAAATSWSGNIPPDTTGWLDSWTDRGVRARYCADPGQVGTLLVYMGPESLMGVGSDQRAVQSAPRVFGRQRQTLHWLDGGWRSGARGAWRYRAAGVHGEHGAFREGSPCREGRRPLDRDAPAHCVGKEGIGGLSGVDAQARGPRGDRSREGGT